MPFLPNQRHDPEAIRELSQRLLGHGGLLEFLNHLPHMALLLTCGRELVYANRALLDSLGFANIEGLLARRPGELLLCLHSSNSQGCGGAEGCRHCQAARVIDEALQTGRQVTREARVSARSEGRLVAYDLKVTARPLELSGVPLIMVFLEDISAQKRREHLERIFIHDLLNTVSGLQMLAEQFQNDSSRVRPAEVLRQVQLLTDELRAQQTLIEAEHGDLVRNIQCVPAHELIEDTLQGLEALSTRGGIAFSVDLPATPVYLATDALLARRVLLNAVKNALEASGAGEVVKLGVADGDMVAVTVWNSGEMSASTRHQVFQRSFSTKGKGRGLGTYSMRLLMENYLGGTASFTSDASAGTTFTLAFPSMKSYLASAG